ncbi:hypothetical protein RhiLY_07693 [Ceratobasidium sp. AG-Ba]|nr:hypothetical protein RhiLY_07693 [Ceratobasidium sp. AG-Ba]
MPTGSGWGRIQPVSDVGGSLDARAGSSAKGEGKGKGRDDLDPVDESSGGKDEDPNSRPTWLLLRTYYAVTHNKQTTSLPQLMAPVLHFKARQAEDEMRTKQIERLKKQAKRQAEDFRELSNQVYGLTERFLGEFRDLKDLFRQGQASHPNSTESVSGSNMNDSDNKKPALEGQKEGPVDKRVSDHILASFYQFLGIGPKDVPPPFYFNTDGSRNYSPNKAVDKHGRRTFRPHWTRPFAINPSSGGPSFWSVFVCDNMLFETFKKKAFRTLQKKWKDAKMTPEQTEVVKKSARQASRKNKRLQEPLLTQSIVPELQGREWDALFHKDYVSDDGTDTEATVKSSVADFFALISAISGANRHGAPPTNQGRPQLAVDAPGFIPTLHGPNGRHEVVQTPLAMFSWTWLSEPANQALVRDSNHLIDLETTQRPDLSRFFERYPVPLTVDNDGNDQSVTSCAVKPSFMHTSEQGGVDYDLTVLIGSSNNNAPAGRDSTGILPSSVSDSVIHPELHQISQARHLVPDPQAYGVSNQSDKHVSGEFGTVDQPPRFPTQPQTLKTLKKVGETMVKTNKEVEMAKVVEEVEGVKMVEVVEVARVIKIAKTTKAIKVVEVAKVAEVFKVFEVFEVVEVVGVAEVVVKVELVIIKGNRRLAAAAEIRRLDLCIHVIHFISVRYKV